MLILVRLIGIMIAVLGALFLFNPKAMLNYIAFWKQGSRFYFIGLLRILFGTIFISAAPQTKYALLITILGVFMLVGGILVFLLGQGKVKAILDWWNRRSPLVLRIMALLALVIGVLIISSV